VGSDAGNNCNSTKITLRVILSLDCVLAVTNRFITNIQQSLRVAFNDGSWSKSCAFVVVTPRHRAGVRLLLDLILLRFNQLSPFLGPVRPGPRTAGVAVAREHQYGYQDCKDGWNDRRPVWKRATTGFDLRHCRSNHNCVNNNDNTTTKLTTSINSTKPNKSYDMHKLNNTRRLILTCNVKKEFLSRVSTLTRDIDIAILSVCLSVHLSVRDVPVSDENGLTYCHSFFLPYGSPIILVLSASNIFTKFRRGHPLQERLIQMGYKNFAIFYNKSVYLADDIRYSYS